jgi:hypothetical protein
MTSVQPRSSRVHLAVPRSEIRSVKDITPLRHAICLKMGPRRRFFDVIVVKGSYTLAPGDLGPAPAVAPIVTSDRMTRADGQRGAAIETPGDLLLGKPGTDVVVTGDAAAPRGVPTDAWTCAVTLQSGATELARHAARATGPRRYRRVPLRGWVAGAPAPTLSTPTRLDHGYGGRWVDDDGRVHRHDDNPSGLGFFDPRSDPGRHPAPRWEPIASGLGAAGEASPLVGFGPIARSWRSRRELAGTHDEAWRARFHQDAARGLPPDYAEDLDPRFFQCAHPDLQTREHVAGEAFLVLDGLVAEHPRLAARLPRVRPIARLLDAGRRWRDQPMPLDTIHVDLARRQVHLVWRIAVDLEDRTRGIVLHTTEE